MSPVTIPDDEAELAPEPATDQIVEPRLRPRQAQDKAHQTTKHHELSHGTTVGVDKRTAQRLKKGTLTIEGRLDLHGMTRDAARHALQRFISFSVSEHRRMVLIITGKGRLSAGQGVLKTEVPRWLNEPNIRPYILSFTYAQQRHGGEGALYVYLKRDRNE